MLSIVMHVGSVETLVQFNYNGQHWRAHVERVLDEYTAEEWSAAEFNSLVMQHFSSTLAADATVEQLCDALLAHISVYEQDISKLIVFEQAEA